MKRSKQKILEMVKNQVKNLDPSAEIMLYGSRARNDAHEESDWDLLVLTERKISQADEKAYRSKIYELELQLGEAFSTIIYNKEVWNSKMKITPFYENVMNEGVLL